MVGEITNGSLQSSRRFCPTKPSGIGAAGTTKPFSHPLGLAVAVIFHAAAATSCVPPASRHLGIAAAFRDCSDFEAFSFPSRIVAVARADQSMGDFVQNNVANSFVGVSLYKWQRKLDCPATVNAKAERSFAAVEAESPVVQVVSRHEIQGQLVGVPGTLGERIPSG